MKKLILLLFWSSSTLFLFAQGGAGFGYQLDYGFKQNINAPIGYNQQIESIQHSFFIRWFNESGRHGHQLYTGLRLDSIGFQHQLNYLDQNTHTMEHQLIDAYLKRVAWRLGYLKQHQFIGTPGKFTVAFNYGLFYEFTSQLKRRSEHDDIIYKLYREQHRHNLIFATGIEVRLWNVAIGYKLEHMFFDMINHDYVRTHDNRSLKGSELRGLQLSPTISFLYFTVHFDFFTPN